MHKYRSNSIYNIGFQSTAYVHKFVEIAKYALDPHACSIVELANNVLPRYNQNKSSSQYSDPL